MCASTAAAPASALLLCPVHPVRVALWADFYEPAPRRLHGFVRDLVGALLRPVFVQPPPSCRASSFVRHGRLRRGIQSTACGCSKVRVLAISSLILHS
eukprot:4199358-Pleurochrysis_carterae.AAC.1